MTKTIISNSVVLKYETWGNDDMQDLLFKCNL